MPALRKFETCEVLAWFRGGTIDDVVLFTPQAEDLSKSSPAKAMALEICEVDRVVASWTEVCFVQFLRATDCHSAIKAAPQMPLFAEAGSQRQGSSTRVEPLIDGGITHSVAPPPPPPPPQMQVRDVSLIYVSGRPRNRFQKPLSQLCVPRPVKEHWRMQPLIIMLSI